MRHVSNLRLRYLLVLMVFSGLAGCDRGTRSPDPPPGPSDMRLDPPPGPMTLRSDPPPGPADMRLDPPPGPGDMRLGRPPGGDKPGACRNVGVPQGSVCRFAGLWPQNCPDCGENWRLYRSSHFVTVGGVEYGFDSGAFRIPADREKEFRTFLQRHPPVPCAGMIIRPPCNPAGTHVKVEIDWPPWVKHVRL